MLKIYQSKLAEVSRREKKSLIRLERELRIKKNHSAQVTRVIFLWQKVIKKKPSKAEGE